MFYVPESNQIKCIIVLSSGILEWPGNQIRKQFIIKINLFNKYKTVLWNYGGTESKSRWKKFYLVYASSTFLVCIICEIVGNVNYTIILNRFERGTCQ